MRRTAALIVIALVTVACTDSAAPTTSTPSTTIPHTTSSTTTSTTTRATSSTTTPTSTTTSTVPLPPPDEYCRDGEPRLVALLARTGITIRFSEDIVFIDAVEQAIAGSMQVADISDVLTGVVALPDGSALVTTHQGHLGAGGVFLVDDGLVTPVLVNTQASTDLGAEVTTIAGFRCFDDGFTIDVVFGVDDLEGDLVSYRGSYASPEVLEQVWVADGDLVGTTERSPDGRLVAVTAWPIDPVFGPLLSVLDADTGEEVTVPFNLGPTFGADDVLLDFPVGLNWLPDGRLLYFFATPGSFDDPDSVAIDLDTGVIEPWDLDAFVDPSSCRFGGVEVATSGNVVIIVDEDTAITIPVDADFVRTTC